MHVRKVAQGEVEEWPGKLCTNADFVTSSVNDATEANQ